jgi:hypothetical protein
MMRWVVTCLKFYRIFAPLSLAIFGAVPLTYPL